MADDLKVRRTEDGADRCAVSPTSPTPPAPGAAKVGSSPTACLRDDAIGSLLFLLYLKQEGIEHGLNPQALTALTLLVAESAPAGKDLMIRLIVNLLAGASG